MRLRALVRPVRRQLGREGRMARLEVRRSAWMGPVRVAGQAVSEKGIAVGRWAEMGMGRSRVKEDTLRRRGKMVKGTYPARSLIQASTAVVRPQRWDMGMARAPVQEPEQVLRQPRDLLLAQRQLAGTRNVNPEHDTWCPTRTTSLPMPIDHCRNRHRTRTHIRGLLARGAAGAVW